MIGTRRLVTASRSALRYLNSSSFFSQKLHYTGVYRSAAARAISSAVMQDNVFAGRQDLQEDQLIAGLRQFIPKNTKIPAFTAEIAANPAEHEEALSALQAAIAAGDFHAQVFEHEHCMRYLLYLIENKMVPFWQGMTAYTYVIALAQFTTKQQLKTSDQKFKSIRHVSVTPLVVNGEIAKDVKTYLYYLIGALNKLQININIDELFDFILNLPPCEQQLVKIGYDSSAQDDPWGKGEDKMLAILVANIPYFQDEHSGICVIPSASIINYVHSKMSSTPLQGQPVLGRVKDEDFRDLHHKDQHPVAYYHLDEIFNLCEAHSLSCGPLPALLHDLTHIFLANLLSIEERNLLQNDLLTLLENVKASSTTDVIQHMINAIVLNLNDYNLTNTNFYLQQESRFQKHVKNVLDETMTNIVTRLKHVLDLDFTVALANMKKLAEEQLEKNKEHPFWLELHAHLDKKLQMMPLRPMTIEEAHMTRRFD